MRANIFIISIAILNILCACDGGEQARSPMHAAHDNPPRRNTEEAMKLNVKSGDKVFVATLEENDAAAKFRQMLPLTLDMPDLNANEKHVRLADSLPTQPIKPGTIHAGDLLLWGDDTLVLFYETFSSSYSYTRLGKLDDATGLAEAVGKDGVTMTFEMQQNAH